MEIRVACEGTAELGLSEMTYFQGDLKSLSEVNYEKLKKQILTKGFKFPFFVWSKGKKNYLIDGHQRYRTLAKMAEDGYQVPDLPVCYIQAENMKDAKEAVLAAASQYGKIEEEGLTAFAKGLGGDIFETVAFQGIDTDSFGSGDRLGLSDIFGDKADNNIESEKEEKPGRKEFDKNSISENEEVEKLMGFKTAISRDDVSLPVRWYEEKGLLEGVSTVLDFGAGMDPHKYERYDPYYDFNPKVLKNQYSVVMCNYVLNVQAHVGARLAIALAVRALVEPGGKALFSAMTQADNGGEEGVVRSSRGFQAFLDPKIFQGELKQVFSEVKKLRYAPFCGWEVSP